MRHRARSTGRKRRMPPRSLPRAGASTTRAPAATCATRPSSMRTQALDRFCAWLEQTPLSQAIQGAAWVVPSVQTVHILAIAAVMSSVLMIDLRLLGMVGRDQPLERATSRFRPGIWWTLPILLATGVVMIIGDAG